MNSSETNFLRDVAVACERHDSYLAYLLTSLAAKYASRGNGLRAKRRRLWFRLIRNLFFDKGEGERVARPSLVFAPLSWLIGGLTSQNPKLSIRDVSILMWIANRLEGESHHMAYGLYRFLKPHDPSGAARLKEVKLRPEYAGHLLTARVDGTTERLNAIVIGCLLARKSGLKFHFSWAQDTPAVANELCSVNNDLPDVFSEPFVANYFVPFTALCECRMSDVPVPDNEFASGQELLQPLMAEERDEKIARSLNFAPPARLPGSGLEHWKEDIGRIIRELLSPAYLVELDQMRDKWKMCIGIHYRGGDVIYGRHRHNKHAVSGKSAPLPVIEDLIQSNPGEKIILFGTPVGDTLDDLRYLEKKYDNLVLSLDLGRSDLDAVVQDSMMMSCCKRLFAFRDTGVSYLATLINPALDIQDFFDVYSSQQFFDFCYNNLENPDYKQLHLSYLNIRALALVEELALKTGVQEALYRNIKQLDPENRMAWIQEPAGRGLGRVED